MKLFTIAIMNVFPTIIDKLSGFVTVILAAAILSGCTSAGSSGRTSGEANLQHKWPITGTSADVLAEGILGTQLSEGLSRDALRNALLSEHEALENGQTGNAVTWQGKNFVIGKVTPQQLYEVGEAQCRRYEHVIVRGAERKSAIGTACKDSSGIWKPLV